MPTPEPAVADGGGEPSTLFALLSDEIRVGIVRELARADGALSFSELRSSVGVADSGRFNYHLKRLRGKLVEKTADGYVLTASGVRAAGAVGETA